MTVFDVGEHLHRPFALIGLDQRVLASMVAAHKENQWIAQRDTYLKLLKFFSDAVAGHYEKSYQQSIVLRAKVLPSEWMVFCVSPQTHECVRTRVVLPQGAIQPDLTQCSNSIHNDKYLNLTPCVAHFFSGLKNYHWAYVSLVFMALSPFAARDAQAHAAAELLQFLPHLSFSTAQVALNLLQTTKQPPSVDLLTYLES